MLADELKDLVPALKVRRRGSADRVLIPWSVSEECFEPRSHLGITIG